jgi:hypothetical protein
MNEKLELMKWLYENGVEPRMWYCRESEMWSPLRESQIIDASDYYQHHDYTDPWIPLEQVLEELPLMVHEEKYPRYFEQHKNSNGTTSFYYQYGGVKYLEETSDDYHLAALRLLKRVKEGEKE